MKLRQVTSSAPGKVILIGEHFVVEREPAIALAIDKRVYVTVRKGVKGVRIHSSCYEGEVDLDLNEVEGVKGYFRAIFNSLAEYREIPPLEITIRSEIPPRYGMGSSAATAVALTRAVAAFLGMELDKEEIAKIAYEAERMVHGSPSGIDNTVSTYGGAIIFRRGEGFLRLNVDFSPVALLVAYSGVPKCTKDLVSKVKELKGRYPTIFEPLYHTAGRLAIEAARALEKGDFTAVGELMNINQGLLSALGVSTLRLETLVHKFREAGALGAKLTGAGGGGCVLALVPRERVEKVLMAIKPYSEWIAQVEVCETGVKVEGEGV